MTNGLRFTPIDPAAWNRYDLFCYFSQAAPTGYSLTVNVEVTRLRLCLREIRDIMTLSQQRGCRHGEITASA